MVIMFVLVVVFIAGVTRLWVWSDAQMAGRQPAYEGSRLAAGSDVPGCFWGYTPNPPTDDYVFGGTSQVFGHTSGNYEGGHYGRNNPGIVVKPNLDVPSIDIDDLDDCQSLRDALADLENSVEDIEEAIPEINKELARRQTVLDYTITQKNNAQGQVEYWQGQVEYWQGQVAANCPCSNPEYDTCASAQAQLTQAENELKIWQEGAVVEEVCGEWGCYNTYNFTAWQNYFSTKEEMAEDWWQYHTYGYSPKNAGYLYSNYTAGVEDWELREEVAQAQRDEMQNALEQIQEALGDIEQLKEQIESKLASLGC
jgi:hypothetical protein